MNILIKLRAYFWVGLYVSIFLIASCTDDSGQVGLELQNPANLAAVYNDSSTVLKTYTVQKQDLISMDIANLAPSMLLGYQVDEKLGIFQNNFMTEINIPTNSVSFGKNPVADSLVMFLNYSYAYGDTNQIQTITVYELNHEDTLYTIDKKPMDESVIAQFYNQKPITTFSFKPSYSGATSKTIRFAFPDDYKDKFLVDTLYKNDRLFRSEVLNGFYFVANPIVSGGAITYIKYNESTRMELYYHYTDSVKNKDTIISYRDTTIYTTFKYPMNSSTFRCNIFNRNYNPHIKYLPFETQPDSSFEQELFYVKNTNALDGRIDITGLQTWKDSGNFTINKAVLYVYVEALISDFDSLYTQHSALELWGIDENFDYYYINEYLMPQGGYSTTNLGMLPDGYGYILNINNTLFNAIQRGDDVLSLVLRSTGTTNFSTCDRTILKGSKDSDHPLKLRITYTKFNAE